MNTSLAITISPPLRYNNKLFKNPNKCQYMDDLIFIRHVFHYNRIGSYIIYPEFDQKGRLHYHGTLNLSHDELVRFYKHAVHKLGNLGFVDHKRLLTFMDKLKWSIYCKKEFGLTRDILEIQSPIMSIGDKKTVKCVKVQEIKTPTLFDYFKLET